MSMHKIISTLSLALLLSTVSLQTVQADNTPKVDIVVISAEVLGNKPLVNNFNPTSAQNDGATAITAIVGHNFTGTTLVSLDDPSSTTLSGAITLNTGCDSDPTSAVCGVNAGYDKITGLSIPANVAPGIYNILVTNAQGTNIASDVKLTVSAPPAGADTQIDSIDPSPVFVTVGGNRSLDINLSDTDSATTYFNISTTNGGTFAPNQDSVAMAASTGTGTTTFTAGGAVGYFVNTFQAGDTAVGGPYDDSKNIAFYVQPPF